MAGNCLAQRQNRAFLGFRLDVDRDAPAAPGVWKVVGYHVVCVWTCVSGSPTVAGRRNVKMRLPFTPCRRGQLRGFGDSQRVRIAAMMMHVVHQRNGEPLAERQQRGRSEPPIVVLERQSSTRRWGW